MTTLSLLAYNTRTGFGDEITSKKLLELVKTLNPDIAFFSDALPQENPAQRVTDLKKSFEELGYDILISATKGTNRTDWTRPMGIMKNSLAAEHFFNGIRGETYNVAVQGKVITGAYLDDRSEHYRLEGIEELKNSDVVMGDFNAMHRNAPLAPLLRFLIPIGNLFKEIDTDTTITTNQVRRFASTFQRFTRMGTGDVLHTLSSYGLVETNPRQIPTMHGIAQLDHILVKPSITFSNFKVHKNIKISDHKPISVTIEF